MASMVSHSRRRCARRARFATDIASTSFVVRGSHTRRHDVWWRTGSGGGWAIDDTRTARRMDCRSAIGTNIFVAWCLYPCRDVPIHLLVVSSTSLARETLLDVLARSCDCSRADVCRPCVSRRASKYAISPMADWLLTLCSCTWVRPD